MHVWRGRTCKRLLMRGDADAHVVLAVTHNLSLVRSCRYEARCVNTRCTASPPPNSTVRNRYSRRIIRCTAFPSRDPTVRSHSTVTRSMFEENYHHAVYTRYATISSFTLLWYNSTKQGSCSSHLRLPRATTPPVSSNQGQHSSALTPSGS